MNVGEQQEYGVPDQALGLDLVRSGCLLHRLPVRRRQIDRQGDRRMGAGSRATGHWLSSEPPGGLLIDPMAYGALNDSRAWHSQAPGNALDFLECKLVERQLDLAFGPVQPVSSG